MKTSTAGNLGWGCGKREFTDRCITLGGLEVPGSRNSKDYEIQCFLLRDIDSLVQWFSSRVYFAPRGYLTT